MHFMNDCIHEIINYITCIMYIYYIHVFEPLKTMMLIATFVLVYYFSIFNYYYYHMCITLLY